MDLKRTMIFVRLTGEGKASFRGPLLSTSRLFGPSMTQQKRCGFDESGKSRDGEAITPAQAVAF